MIDKYISTTYFRSLHVVSGHSNEEYRMITKFRYESIRISSKSVNIYSAS